MSTEIAFDSNRVEHRPQRVFHATWCEMNGLSVWLTPTTAQEIAGRVSLWDIEGSVEALDDEWRRRSNDPGLTKTVRYDLLMQQWWGKEWMRPDSPYKILPMTPKELQRAEALLETIPAKAFRGLREEEVATHRDARIICESIARGVRMLVTGNMVTIDHIEINRWAREMRRSKGWPEAERDAVKVADVAMVEWSEGKEKEFLMAGLAASWLDERTAPADAIVRAFRERMARMAGARLEMTGERLLNLAHGERDLATRIEETRARLPEKTRAAETRERRYRAAAAIGR